MLNSFSVALLLHHCQDGLHHTSVSLQEQITLPSHQMQGVDVVDVLFAFVHLPLDPVAVEISEQMVVVLSSGGVALPLFDVEMEKSLITALLCG